MNDLRTAAQQALEAMRCAVPTGKITLADWHKSIAELEAVLAQEQAEPVEPVEPVATHRINSWGFCGVCRHDRIPGEGCARQECPDSPQQAEPVLQTCNCRWDGEVQVQQCTLHEAHIDAIHEWAERAKVAERKLAQQAEPVCKCDLRTRLVGDGCEVCNPGLAAELAQQGEPVEPVAWECKAGGLKALTQRQYDAQPPNIRRHYTRIAPPQRKPLPKHDQHCVDVPGYGLMAVRLVRAVERAHGITDPQIEDRLARHGIPMPGDSKC